MVLNNDFVILCKLRNKNQLPKYFYSALFQFQPRAV